MDWTALRFGLIVHDPKYGYVGMVVWVTPEKATVLWLDAGDFGALGPMWAGEAPDWRMEVES